MDLGEVSWEKDTKFDLIIAANLTSVLNLNILSTLESVRNLLKVGSEFIGLTTTGNAHDQMLLTVMSPYAPLSPGKRITDFL